MRPLSFAGRAANDEWRPRISSGESMRRRCRRRNYWSPSSYRSCKIIPGISSTNSHVGTVTTRSPVWRRRQSLNAMSSRTFAWRFLPSAIGRYWPRPRRNSSTSPSRRQYCRMHRQRSFKSSPPTMISRPPLPCAVTLRRCCSPIARLRFLAAPTLLPGDLCDRCPVNLARRQRRACRCAGAAASQSGGLSARASAADWNACWLRAWGLRSLHGAREWGDRSILSHAGGADARRICRNHRGIVRQRRDRRFAGRLSQSQCVAMRLLHARNADGRPGFAETGCRAGSEADPRAPFRQLLPLHRLPGHHRCGRDHGARAHRTQVMIIASATPEILSVLDRPNSYIGKLVPRPNLERLMQGRGLYVSDMELPRMGHVAFLRSPHAHAKITAIDAAAARRLPGVLAIAAGAELAAVIPPWGGGLSHSVGLKAAPQRAIAIDRVCWQGEAVAAV